MTRLPAVRHRTRLVFRRRRSADAGDPEKYLPRINHVHLKDVRPPVIDQVRRDGLSFLDGVKKAPSPCRATG
jgi:hypothetical protein